MMYTVSEIKEYINKYHVIIEKAIESEHYNVALDSLYHCGALQHIVNISLLDEISENYLLRIARTFERIEYEEPETYCIYYDSIGVDNIALSWQYLTALIASNKEFYYIINAGNKQKNGSRKLLELANSSKTCHVVIIDIEKTMVERVERIRHIIRETKPSKAILHMNNSDSIGCVAFSNVAGCTRYMINHGDEQFWLGTCCLDYVIEFRGMGKSASIQYRKLQERQCLVLPYYPIIKTEEFQGFDFQIPSNAVSIFSGGRFVKVYAENGMFMEIVSNILHRHSNTFFVFAGSGDPEPMLKYIKDNRLDERWKVITYRSDLLEVLKRMNIYLGTYPQSGGLMAQYAAAAGLPIVEMNTNNGGVTEDLFPHYREERGYRITHSTWKEYNEQVDRLIKDVEYRSGVSKLVKSYNMTESEFNEELMDLLDKNESHYLAIHREIDLAIRTKRLLEAENAYLHRIPGIMCNRNVARYYPITALINLFRFFYYKRCK